MPILVTPTVERPLPTGQVFPPTYDTARWQWTSPAGVVRDLMSTHPYLRPGGVTGHMAAPVELQESLPPGLDGGMYRGVRVLPRDVFLTLMAHTRDANVWRDLSRALVRDLSGGEGVLTVMHVGGERRSLRGHYAAGAESPVEGEPGAVKIGTYVIQVRAYDPWWYGDPLSRTFTVQAAQDFLPSVARPTYVLMPNLLAGSGKTITNPGDVDAYPVWTVTGPLASVTCQLGDRSFTVEQTLGPGETLTVDTDPRVGAFDKIVDKSGQNLWGIATSDYPDLWPLPPGESVITVDADGASDDTRIVMRFNPRYRTA